MKNKKRRLLVAGSIILAIAAVFLCVAHTASGSEKTSYGEAEVTAVTMEQTLTAAGEIKAASSESIAFSTTKTFAGMCVEEGDAVRKGQHLISYQDGTYKDAPDEGIVTAINAPKTGNVASGDHSVTLEYTDTLLLEIAVPEDEISEISKGDTAKIVVNADTSKTFDGTITQVRAMSTTLLNASEDAATGDGEADAKDGEPGGSGSTEGSESTGTAYYQVNMKLTNDGTLKPGMSAGCTITISSRKSVLAVPIEAVLFDAEGNSYVNRMEGAGVVQQTVTTGESDANFVEITEGLELGETVQIEVKE